MSQIGGVLADFEYRQSATWTLRLNAYKIVISSIIDESKYFFIKYKICLISSYKYVMSRFQMCLV